MNTDKLVAYSGKVLAQHPEITQVAGAAVAVVTTEVVAPVAIIALPFVVAGGAIYGISKMVKGD